MVSAASVERGVCPHDRLMWDKAPDHVNGELADSPGHFARVVRR